MKLLCESRMRCTWNLGTTLLAVTTSLVGHYFFGCPLRALLFWRPTTFFSGHYFFWRPSGWGAAGWGSPLRWGAAYRGSSLWCSSCSSGAGDRRAPPAPVPMEGGNKHVSTPRTALLDLLGDPDLNASLETVVESLISACDHAKFSPTLFSALRVPQQAALLYL